MLSNIYDLASLELGMIIIVIEICGLLLVWMTLTFIKVTELFAKMETTAAILSGCG